MRLDEPLRLEPAQVVEHPLSRHADRLRDLRRRLRPLKELKEPQPRRLQGHARTHGLVDNLETFCGQIY